MHYMLIHVRFMFKFACWTCFALSSPFTLLFELNLLDYSIIIFFVQIGVDIKVLRVDKHGLVDKEVEIDFCFGYWVLCGEASILAEKKEWTNQQEEDDKCEKGSNKFVQWVSRRS